MADQKNGVVFRTRCFLSAIIGSRMLVAVVVVLSVIVSLRQKYPSLRRRLPIVSGFEDGTQFNINLEMIKIVWRMCYNDAYANLKPGKEAPNVEVYNLAGTTSSNIRDFQKAGRPLVLCFGSVSCPPFMSKLHDFNPLVSRFDKIADFLMVYMAEAHAADGWSFAGNKYSIPAHVTLADRRKSAAQFAALYPACPVVVDCMDDAADIAYAAAPNRLFVILDNRLVYVGGLGPGDFNPKELGQWLNSYAGSQ